MDVDRSPANATPKGKDFRTLSIIFMPEIIIVAILCLIKV